ncbi:MAG: hydroxyethylthiazole kinase, partial [Corynebacterium sp.]|nr:hydroxyethylthiazole kinase [Corynebacterium sp.]
MSDTLATTVDIISSLRRDQPLVQCITNQVVPQVTANVLLAAGAAPAMVDTPEEAAEFAALASGLLVNTGSPTAAQYTAMREAVRGANAAGTPWVLAPVAC